MATPISPICYNCKHFDIKKEKRGTFVCKAYPSGIPEGILIGKIDHTKPYKGDNGIQFEPIRE